MTRARRIYPCLRRNHKMTTKRGMLVTEILEVVTEAFLLSEDHLINQTFLMPEVPDPREDHCQSQPIGGFNHFLIAH
jgi:hypothetical protein